MICPRCKREAVGWPLERGDRCSPPKWAKCIREPYNIRKEEELKRGQDITARRVANKA